MKFVCIFGKKFNYLIVGIIKKMVFNVDKMFLKFNNVNFFIWNNLYMLIIVKVIVVILIVKLLY